MRTNNWPASGRGGCPWLNSNRRGANRLAMRMKRTLFLEEIVECGAGVARLRGVGSTYAAGE
jgi:hypothetical protein